jgi:hypothetical protein
LLLHQRNSTLHRDSDNCSTRVARWFIIKPKITIWAKLGGPGNGKCCYVLWPFVIFFCHLVMAVWYSFWSFGTFSRFDMFGPRRIWQPCVQPTVSQPFIFFLTSKVVPMNAGGHARHEVWHCTLCAYIRCKEELIVLNWLKVGCAYTNKDILLWTKDWSSSELRLCLSSFEKKYRNHYV